MTLYHILPVMEGLGKYRLLSDNPKLKLIKQNKEQCTHTGKKSWKIWYGKGAKIKALPKLSNWLATVVKGDPKAPFLISTTPLCKGGLYSIPRIAALYPWSFESLVWLDLGLKPGLLDHWWTLYSIDQWLGLKFSNTWQKILFDSIHLVYFVWALFIFISFMSLPLLNMSEVYIQENYTRTSVYQYHFNYLLPFIYGVFSVCLNGGKKT